MPTYEYKCPACKHEFEVERRITDESPQECPNCALEACTRLIGSTSFILKGGNWFGSAKGRTASQIDKEWLSHFPKVDDTSDDGISTKLAEHMSYSGLEGDE